MSGPELPNHSTIIKRPLRRAHWTKAACIVAISFPVYRLHRKKMLEPENVSLIEVLINSSLVYSYQLATLFLWGLFFLFSVVCLRSVVQNGSPRQEK